MSSITLLTGTLSDVSPITDDSAVIISDLPADNCLTSGNVSIKCDNSTQNRDLAGRQLENNSENNCESGLTRSIHDVQGQMDSSENINHPPLSVCPSNNNEYNQNNRETPVKFLLGRDKSSPTRKDLIK